MRKIITILASIFALIPGFAIADDTASSEAVSSSNAESGIRPEDAVHFNTIFNIGETQVPIEAARCRFFGANNELEPDQLELAFQRAVLELEAKGLLKNKGISLEGGHSGYRAE